MRLRAAMTATLMACVVTIAHPALAGVWQLTNDLRDVSAVAVDPATPSTVHVVTSSRVLKSNDGGSSWSSASLPLAGLGFLTAAIAPATPSTIFVATANWGSGSPVILKTTDAGGSWKRVNSGLSISVLAVGPSDADTLYAANGDGVFESTDGGSNWSSMGFSVPAYSLVSALAIDPQTPGTVLVAARGSCPWGDCMGGPPPSFLFKTTDAGASWKPLNVPGGWMPISGLSVAPASPDALYAATPGGLFKSTDGGESWEVAGSGLPNLGFAPTLALDPSAPDTAYLGDRELFKTADGGKSWILLTTGFPAASVSSFASDTAIPNTLYASTDAGVLATEDGRTWKLRNAGVFDHLTIDPSNPRTLYATAPNGEATPIGDIPGTDIFKTTDGGENWTLISGGVRTPDVQSLAIDPTSPGTIYAATWLGVFKTRDDGHSWDGPEIGNVAVSAVVIDPQDPRVVYALTSDRGVYKSVDAGQSWDSVGPPEYASVLAMDPTNPGTLYAGTGLGVYKTVDGGQNWNAIYSGSCSQLAIDPNNAKTVYIVTDEGIFRTMDGGVSWRAVTRGWSPYVGTFAVSPTSPGTLYVADLEYGLVVLQPLCGDGIVDAGEQCDDGNTTDGDGCNADCTTTPKIACSGDCDGSGTVTVDELITLVDIALGAANSSACAAGMTNTPVTIDQLVTAVNHALNGCGA